MRRSYHLLLAVLLVAGLPAAVSGATWQPEQVLIPGATPVYTTTSNGRAAGVTPDGHIHVVVQSHLDETTFEIRHTHRGTDGTWSDPLLLSDGINAQNPSLTVDGEGGLHVVWEDVSTSRGEIVYRTRTPAGIWEEPVTLSSGLELSRDPVVSSDSFGGVHAVWVDADIAQPRLLHALRSPEGVWAEPRIVSIDGASPERPTLAADGIGNVHLSWSDRVGTPNAFGVFNHELFYVRLTPEDPAIPPPTRLTSNLGVSLEPFLDTTSDGTVHLVWIDNRDAANGNEFEIYYKRFLPGIGWGHDKRFTYDLVGHRHPVIAAGAGNTLNVAWEDFRHGNPEIYFRQITLETGWDPIATRLTLDDQPSIKPSMVALEGGELVLLWTDAEDSSSLRVYAKDGAARAEGP